MSRSARTLAVAVGAAVLAYAVAVVCDLPATLANWTQHPQFGTLTEVAVPLLVLVVGVVCSFHQQSRSPGVRSDSRGAVQSAFCEGDGQLRLLLEKIPAIVWATDTQLRYTCSAGAGLAALTAEVGALDGRTLDQQFGADDDASLPTAAHRQALRGEPASYEFSAGRRTYQAHVEPLRNSNDTIIGCIGIALDVTERTRVERALKASHSLLTAIVEGTQNPIFVTDMNGRFVLVNSKAAELVGRPVEEIIGRDDAAIFPPELAQRIAEEDRRIFATGESGSYERVGVMVNGEERSYLNTKSIYRDHDGKPLGLVGIAHDITDRRRAEEQVRRHQAELAHAGRLSAAGEMASELAHELNQPLAVILSGAELCLRLAHSQGGNSPEALGILADIAAQAERAGQIVHRLKAFVAKRKPHRMATDVNAVARNAAGLAKVEAAAGDVTVQLELADALPTVQADAIQIEQVILNLMRNGMQAMADTPVNERRLTVRTVAQGNGGIRLAVSDTGRGLAEQDVEKLFDPFCTTRPEGMGLGLSLSRSIIEAHGGRLWATSDLERGAMFNFTLPPEGRSQEENSGETGEVR